jgi:lysophospholipid acyltransferase (LPLAT)-like uncharacterized protein
VRFAFLARLIGRVMAAYALLVARTARLRGEVTTEPAVLAFWHEYNLAAVVVSLMRRREVPHASFSTRGFRGVVITTMLERLDVRVFPLPHDGADRAESRALAVRLGRLAADGLSPVVTPDGPFGPYRTAKPGALIVARAAGLPIVPWAVRCRPSFRLTRRWDRHVVPLPFSRIRVVEGAALQIGARERIGPSVARLQAALDDAASRG